MLNSEAHCERHCKARLWDVQLLGQFKLLTLKVLSLSAALSHSHGWYPFHWCFYWLVKKSIITKSLLSHGRQSHGQFRPFHKVWLLRDDCMKFHFKVRTNLAKTWQNMTQMLLNVALLRAHVHLLQGRNRLQSQNTGLHRSSNFLWCIFEKLDISKCIQMWIQYHL